MEFKLPGHEQVAISGSLAQGGENIYVLKCSMLPQEDALSGDVNGFINKRIAAVTNLCPTTSYIKYFR